MNKAKLTLRYKRHMMLTALAASLAPCLLTGCDDDLTGEAETRASRVICFSTAAIDEATTRAASVADSVWSGTAYDPVTHDSLPIFGQVLPWDAPESGVSTRGELITTSNLTSFSVSAIQTRTDTKETTTLFTNEENTRPSSSDNSTPSENSTWVYDSGKIYYWPGDAFTLDFYAVAPADVVTSNGFSYANDDTRNEFTYIVPSSPDKQQDLMVASETKVKGNNNEPVELAFKHICAAVEFEVGNADDFSGTITEIRVSGIANTATYTFGSGWSTPSGSDTYSITPGTGNTFGDNQRLILLPQTLGSDAKIEVVYTLNGATTSSTYTYSLSGQTWAANNRYHYSVNISPEMTITFDNSQLDAHYTTTTATISVLGLKDTESWILTAAGSTTDNDGNDVSIQLEDSVDSYVKDDGYWLQNLRGTNQFSRKGSGTYSVRIFAPENAGEDERTITFTLTSGKKTLATNTDLKQYCPAWTEEGYGWERDDEGLSGSYGLERTKHSVYVVPYARADLEGMRAFSTLLKLISDYNASSYVLCDDRFSTEYTYKPTLGTTRHYFVIQYDKISENISDIYDLTNGLSNTEKMSSFSSFNTICPFEIAVQNTYKIENGKTDEHMFRHPNKDEEPYEKVIDETGKSGILSSVLKKNAYHIVEGTENTGNHSQTNSLELVELKWYLPAKDENAGFSSDFSGSAGEYWSSTAVEDDNTKAYLLDGTDVARDGDYKVRTVRLKK
jgi:hypothetical protein